MKSKWLKQIARVVPRVVLGLAATVAVSSVMAQDVLISGHSSSGRGPFGEGIKWFHGEVEKRSGGEVKIDPQWGGALFKAPAARQSIADGISDLGMVIGAYTPREMVAYTIADLPVLGADPWVGMRAIHEMMVTEPSIKAQLDEQNLVYLGSYTTSAVQLICNGAPVTNIEDIKGRKIRGIGVYGKVFKELGANLIPMSYYKAYQALDTGLIDCTQGYSYSTRSLKHYEVADNITLINWGQVGALGMFANKEAFDRLSPKLQQVLREVGADIADYYGERVSVANEESLVAMQAGIDGRKFQVHTLSDEQRSVLISKGESYIRDWVENANQSGLDGEALLMRIKALVAKYEKQRDEQGYPWAQ